MKHTEPRENPFRPGGRYEHRKGFFTVISIAKAEMRIRWDTGEEARASIAEQARILRNMQADAASAYARSLKGWPQSAWAGDSVVRLAAALIELKRADDACRALVEYDSRYAAKSPVAVKTRAKDVRTRAACG